MKIELYSGEANSGIAHVAGNDVDVYTSSSEVFAYITPQLLVEPGELKL